MATRGFNSILTECVDQMRAGATVDQCVSRHPLHAERLRPMLTLAEKVMHTPMAHARPDAQERAWMKLQVRVEELRNGKRVVPAPVRSLGWNYRAWLKPMAIAGAVTLFFASSAGGVVYASQDALPDSPLYGVKLATEDARLWFVTDDERKAEILLEQSTQRMEEIMAIVAKGKPVPDNALSAMHDRNERAADILQERPEDTSLRAQVLTLAQVQEERLVALWPQVPEGARPEYAETVAHLHNTRLDGGSGQSFVSVRPEELTGGIINISGPAEEQSEGVWKVGGMEVRIDDRTIGRQGLENGTSATFVVAKSSNGRLYALSLFGQMSGSLPTGAFVSGAVEEVTDEGIVVAGQLIRYDDTTLPITSVQVGDRVQVTLNSTSSGFAAGAVQTATPTIASFTFEGTVEGDVSNSTANWSVGGRQFLITDSTDFDLRAGDAADGARVQVEALNRDGQLEALRVAVLSSVDTSETSNIIGTFDGYDDVEGVWRISGVEVVPPGNFENPAYVQPEVGSLVSVDLELEGADFITTGIFVVEKPDQPALVRFQGTINNIDNTRWTLEFGQVRVGSIAKVQGRPLLGTRVIVWGERGTDGSLQATYVRVLDDIGVLTPTPTAPAPTAMATP